MRPFIALLLTLSFISVKAENGRKVDSLSNLISNPGHDTSLAAAYIALSNILYASNLDTVIPLCLKAKEVAEKNLANNLSQEVKRKFLSSLADALNNIGVVNYQKGNISKALKYYHLSLEKYEDAGVMKDVATSLNNLGIIYDQQGNILKALEYYHKSLKLYEDADHKKGIAMTLNNLGIIYDHQEDTSRALEYFQKTLALLEEIGDQNGVAATLLNLGELYADEGNSKLALEYFQKSLAISRKLNDKMEMAESLNKTGRLYIRQRDTIKALDYFMQSLELEEEIGHQEGIATALHNIGLIKLRQGNLTAAYKRGKRGLDISLLIGAPNIISRNARLLSSISKRTGDYEESLIMYELYIKMRDSIKNEETQKATIRQQTKYEFEKAQLVREQEERELTRARAETLSRRDNLQYSIVLICLLVIGGLVAMLGRLSLPERVAEGLIFFAFLIFFEFILVLADPYVEKWTGGAPGLKLLINAGVAAFIFPLHSLFERKLKGRLINQPT